MHFTCSNAPPVCRTDSVDCPYLHTVEPWQSPSLPPPEPEAAH